jgi:hypothetical protein
MKTLRVLTLTTLALLATQAQAAETFDLSRLAWLEGLWAGTKDGIAMEERWTSPAGGALLGMHRDIKDGRMVSFEFFRVATTNEGTFYFASPRSKPPVPFRLVTLEATRVVFENKEHDFPQRVLYWLEADGRLHARTEGLLKGKLESEDWVWTKTPDTVSRVPDGPTSAKPGEARPLVSCRMPDGTIVTSHECPGIPANAGTQSK